MLKPLNKVKSEKLFILLYIFLLPITFIPATWNVDLIHDAAIAAPAGALAHGKILYHDVYSAFGPLGSWIIYPFFKIFGVHLVVYRILGAALFWITGFVIFKTLKDYLGPKLSIALASTWLLTSSGFVTLKSGDAKLIFWTTNLGVLLILLSYIIIKNSNNDLNKLNKRFIFASFIMMATITIRLEFFISWLSVLIIWLLIYGRSKLVFCWLLGGVALIGCFVIQLYISGVLQMYIDSNIYYYRVIASLNSPLQTGKGFFYMLLPLMLVILTALILLLFISFFYKLDNIRVISYSVVFTIIFLSLHSYYQGKMDQELRGIKFYSWLDLFSRNIPLSYVSICLVIFPLLIIARFKYIINLAKQNRSIFKFDPSFFIIPISASTYFYLHNPNPAYAHAFTPLMILGIFSLWSKDSSEIDLKVKNMLSKGTILILVISIGIFATNIGTNRFSYNTPFLLGMTDSSNEKAKDFKYKFEFVKNVYSIGHNYRFKCSEWLLVLNEKYYYPEKFFNSEGRFEESYCGLPLSD